MSTTAILYHRFTVNMHCNLKDHGAATRRCWHMHDRETDNVGKCQINHAVLDSWHRFVIDKGTHSSEISLAAGYTISLSNGFQATHAPWGSGISPTSCSQSHNPWVFVSRRLTHRIKIRLTHGVFMSDIRHHEFRTPASPFPHTCSSQPENMAQNVSTTYRYQHDILKIDTDVQHSKVI
uniref:Uncharacterized protein n=1 Tax=Setaria italica TaxID=4555 RepID=K3Z294_SETIT